MKTYSFSYINQRGCGDMVEVKDFETDQEAMKHGRELLELYVQDITNCDNWQDPRIAIDKWENGYPYTDTFDTEDAEDPEDSAYVIYERDNGSYNDDCTEFNYHYAIKEQGFEA